MEEEAQKGEKEAGEAGEYDKYTTGREIQKKTWNFTTDTKYFRKHMKYKHKKTGEEKH